MSPLSTLTTDILGRWFVLALVLSAGWALQRWHRHQRAIRLDEQAFADYQRQFQRIVATMSQAFMAGTYENHDHLVKQALADLGSFFAVDRTYIFSFCSPEATVAMTGCLGQNTLMNNTYEWCASGIEPQIDNLQGLPSALFPWWMRHLQRGEVIQVEDVDAMPDEAHQERDTLQSQGIQSVLVVPMFSHGQLAGFIGFDAVRNQEVWQDTDSSLLKIAAELIQSALDRHQMETQLREQARLDPLTNLPNRRHLEHVLTELENEPAAIIMADVDGLKLVNDSFGHQQGDALLRLTAKALAVPLRPQDTAARWGGDEFILVLPGLKAAYAEEIMASIQSIAGDMEGAPIPLSLSMGTAQRQPGQPWAHAFKAAEDAMYRSKTLNARSSRSAMVKSLQNTLRVKSHETEGHCRNMEILADHLGQRIGFSAAERNSLRLLAVLHDLGKVGIPEEILEKPSSLTPEEWSIMQTHPEIGYRIAVSIPDLLPIAEGILSHHERWDGQGYPRGLHSTEIPLAVRIVTLIDAYDAMTHDRPYSRARSQAEAITELQKEAGRQFDPRLVEEFVALLEEEALVKSYTTTMNRA